MENFRDETTDKRTDREIEAAIDEIADNFFRPKKVKSKKKAHDDDNEKNDNDSGDFDDLDIPTDALSKLLKFEELPENKAQVECFLSKYWKKFPRWTVYLAENFNVCLYGFGSKRRLLENYAQYIHESGYSTFVVSAYDSQLSMAEVLTQITDALDFSSKDKNSVRYLIKNCGLCEGALKIRDIVACDESRYPDIFVLVHNLDGLRSQEAQQAWGFLAEIRPLRLVASIDHVNTQLMWDQPLLDRFRWIYQFVPTYASYSVELLASDSSILGLSGVALKNRAHTLSSLESVWSALTSNAKKVLQHLVRLWLKGQKTFANQEKSEKITQQA